MAAVTNSDAQTRISEQGRTLSTQTIQSFLLAALSHEATVEPVDQLLYHHVVEGRLHPSVVAASLRPIIDDVIQTATAEDWAAIAHQLAAEARDALGNDADESLV